VLESTVGGVLRDAARQEPDQLALIAALPGDAAHQRWTYGELLADAEAAAGALLSRFEPGERIAVWAPNIPEWVLLQYGAALAGLTLVTVNPAFRPKELQYALGQSRASGVILVPEYRGSPMASFLEEVRPSLPELREVTFGIWSEPAVSAARADFVPRSRPDPAGQLLAARSGGGAIRRRSALGTASGCRSRWR
jgi:fatty-acyl-CoA synthase